MLVFAGNTCRSSYKHQEVITPTGCAEVKVTTVETVGNACIDDLLIRVIS